MYSKSIVINNITATRTSIVSFDFFGTLVTSPFWEPTDLFILMEEKIQKEFGIFDIPCFCTLRVTAEKNARQKLSNREEITINDIYKEMGLITRLSEKQLDYIRKLEIEHEFKYCQPRECGRVLWDVALAAGKTIIVISDTYLPKEAIAKILHNCGYEGESSIFVSSDIGLSKSTGNLFAYAQNKMGVVSSGKYVHIGENIQADYSMPRKKGWRCFPLYNTRLLMQNKIRGHKFSDPLLRCFESSSGNVPTKSAMDFLGIRCMLAVIANKLFDDPFIQTQDLVCNTTCSGYFALGMYLTSVALWLYQECIHEGYDRMCFLARDGRLPMEAFKMIITAVGDEVPIEYIRVSRIALLPLMINKQEDLMALGHILGELEAYSPRSVLRYMAPISRALSTEMIDEKIKAAGYDPEQPFGTQDACFRFMDFFWDQLYDTKASQEYRNNAELYFTSMIRGNCALFDVGYNLRSEIVLQKLSSANITSYSIHQNNDLAIRRGRASGIRYKTLYDYTPYVSWLVREMLLEPDEPPCSGYDSLGMPILIGRESSRRVEKEAVLEFQRAGLNFVNDFTKQFGEDLFLLPLRYTEGCIPFETFLCSSTQREIRRFRKVSFENDFYAETPKLKSAWLLMQAERLSAVHKDGKWKRRIRIGARLFMSDQCGFWDRAVRFFKKRVRHKLY